MKTLTFTINLTDKQFDEIKDIIGNAKENDRTKEEAIRKILKLGISGSLGNDEKELFEAFAKLR